MISSAAYRNAERIAVASIALALAIAELIRPTHWQSKRVSHATTVALGGVALDSTILQNIPPIARLALGSIDVIQVDYRRRKTTLGPHSVVPLAATLVLTGWAGDPVTRSAPAGAFVSVDGRERIDISSFFIIPRADVARYYGDPALTRVGFRAPIRAARLGEGTHELQFGVIAVGGRGFYPLAGPIDVTVAAAGLPPTETK